MERKGQVETGKNLGKVKNGQNWRERWEGRKEEDGERRQSRGGREVHVAQLIKCSLPLSVGDVEDETADGKQHSQTAVGVDHSHHGWVGEVLHLNGCPVWWYPIRPD